MIILLCLPAGKDTVASEISFRLDACFLFPGPTAKALVSAMI
jgi:hypothetical protein